MCGRFFLDVEFEELLTRYDLRYFDIDYSKASEIFPTNDVLTISNYNSIKTPELMRWGFVTSFSNKPLINARSEGIYDKKTFMKPMELRRCIVPASGYFEWRKEDAKKIKTKIQIKDKKIISLAACYQVYLDNSGKKVKMVSILTKDAVDSIKYIHDRMPVILNKDVEEVYLSKEASRNEIEQILNYKEDYDFYLDEIV